MKLRFTGHAMNRFRERWPDSGADDSHKIVELLSKQVEQAKKRGDYVITPSGVLYPITFLGKDGYVAIKRNVVTTVLPEEWCKDVDYVRSLNGNS